MWGILWNGWAGCGNRVEIVRLSESRGIVPNMNTPPVIREVHGPEVQEMWPGRLCDKCRALGKRAPHKAIHAYNSEGGGRDFFCREHNKVVL